MLLFHQNSKLQSSLQQFFLINRLPTPILHEKSSSELMFKYSPCYTSLWIFGYAWYPYLTHFKSNRCVFLGYFSKHKGYYCFHILIGCMFISKHVLLYETTFHFSTQQHSYDPLNQLFKLHNLPNILHTIPNSYPPDSTILGNVSSPVVLAPHVSATLALSCVSSQDPMLASIRTHLMITQNQDGTRWTKIFLTTRHLIPTCFMTNLINQPQES